MIRRVACIAAAATVLGVGVAAAFSNNPPIGRTNAISIGAFPAETNCTSCHGTFPLNPANGSVQIDAPDFYMANSIYPITVRLTNSLADTTGLSNPRWGFQLTSIRATTGAGVGTLLSPNSGGSPTFPDSLTVAPGSGSFVGRQYIRHTGFATRTDKPSPVTWTFNWQAPATDQGKVYFFATGNSANGDGGTSNDYIFASVDSANFTSVVPGPGGLAWLTFLGAGMLLAGGYFLTRQAVRREA